MPTITIRMKNGTEKAFTHKPRPGGSYTNSLAAEGGFAVVTDEYGKKIWIPADDIREIEEIPERF